MRTVALAVLAVGLAACFIPLGGWFGGDTRGPVTAPVDAACVVCTPPTTTCRATCDGGT
jgi:hypothetical protein